MTKRDKLIFVYGAGGHGKVVADALLAARVPVRGFIDDDHSKTGEVLRLKVFGGGNWLVEKSKQREVAAALGIGNNGSRRNVAEACLAAGIRLITVVHPSAVVAPSARIGQGTVVMAGSLINSDSQIGMGVIVNTGAIIEHDCRVEDFAHLSPGCILGGGARIGSLCWLGMGSLVIHGVAVGSNTTVGAGAVVTKDAEPGVTVVGVPAKPLVKKA